MLGGARIRLFDIRVNPAQRNELTQTIRACNAQCSEAAAASLTVRALGVHLRRSGTAALAIHVNGRTCSCETARPSIALCLAQVATQSHRITSLFVDDSVIMIEQPEPSETSNGTDAWFLPLLYNLQCVGDVHIPSLKAPALRPVTLIEASPHTLVSALSLLIDHCAIDGATSLLYRHSEHTLRLQLFTFSGHYLEELEAAFNQLFPTTVALRVRSLALRSTWCSPCCLKTMLDYFADLEYLNLELRGIYDADAFIGSSPLLGPVRRLATLKALAVYVASRQYSKHPAVAQYLLSMGLLQLESLKICNVFLPGLTTVLGTRLRHLHLREITIPFSDLVEVILRLLCLRTLRLINLRFENTKHACQVPMITTETLPEHQTVELAASAVADTGTFDMSVPSTYLLQLAFSCRKLKSCVVGLVKDPTTALMMLAPRLVEQECLITLAQPPSTMRYDGDIPAVSLDVFDRGDQFVRFAFLVGGVDSLCEIIDTIAFLVHMFPTIQLRGVRLCSQDEKTIEQLANLISTFTVFDYLLITIVGDCRDLP